MATTLDINGKAVTAQAAPDTPLLWVLRDELGLTGTKFGCGLAQCGACTVHLDGQPIRSCVTLIAAVGAGKITTIEGLGGAHPVQQAWVRHDVPQCGYCQSGQIMSAAALLVGANTFNIAAEPPRPSSGSASGSTASIRSTCWCGAPCSTA